MLVESDRMRAIHMIAREQHVDGSNSLQLAYHWDPCSPLSSSARGKEYQHAIVRRALEQKRIAVFDNYPSTSKCKRTEPISNHEAVRSAGQGKEERGMTARYVVENRLYRRLFLPLIIAWHNEKRS